MSRDELEAKLNELLHEADEQRRTADELEHDANEMMEHANAHRHYSWELLGRAAAVREQIDSAMESDAVKSGRLIKMYLSSVYGKPGINNVETVLPDDELMGLLNKLFESLVKGEPDA